MNLAQKRNCLSTLVILLISFNLFSQQGTVIINQDKEIEALLKLKKTIKSSSDGYKIQIYSGLSRSAAEASRTEFLENYSDWSSSIEYETPNYKIWVGNFRNRLEADRALIRIKKTFMNAFIFQPKKK
ncbi:MAG: SPOR domain-containing protein [Flavobacteriaceae bacterium]|nr:SPOR domain-containing protein [Bacteroidia bacterium]NNL16829.1 SPOR domain-containing protein [Flavobacteriaceae bacterium]